METEASPIISNLLLLAPVVVGGLIGVFGSWLGGMAIYRAQSKDTNIALFRDKLEQLVTIAYSLKFWFEKLENHYVHRDDCDVPPYPIDQLQMLTTIYLPELNHEVISLTQASNKYRLFVIQHSAKPKSEYVAGMSEYYEALASKIDALAIAAGELMRKRMKTA